MTGTWQTKNPGARIELSRLRAGLWRARDIYTGVDLGRVVAMTDAQKEWFVPFLAERNEAGQPRGITKLATLEAVRLELGTWCEGHPAALWDMHDAAMAAACRAMEPELRPAPAFEQPALMAI